LAATTFPVYQRNVALSGDGVPSASTKQQFPVPLTGSGALSATVVKGTTLLVSDSFSGADVVALSGTALDYYQGGSVASRTWSSSATIGRQGGKCYVSNTAGFKTARVDLGVKNAYVEVLYDTVSGANISVLGRYVDTNNNYRLIGVSTGEVIVEKVVAGTATEILRSAAGVGGPGKRHGLWVNGTTVAAYVDDTLVFATTDTGVPEASAGTNWGIGFFSGSTTGFLDNFRVAPTPFGGTPAVTALTGAGTLAATVTKAGILLGEWGFLDNLNDTSGNGHTATYTPGSGSNFSYVTGPHPNSRAAQFAHANDVIGYGRTGLEPTLDGITIMAWTRLSPAPSSGFVDFLGVLNKARAAGSSRSRMGYGFSQPVIPQMKAVARWKDDLQVRDAGATWNDTNWHHLAVVDGNTRWATYLDGVQIDGGTRALGAAPNTAWENFPWLSGYNGDIGDNYAHPNLSVTAVRIFQGELTTADVNTWMNTPIVPVVPSPYAYYDFHEASGSTAADIMGHMPVLTTNNPAAAWSGPNAIYDFHNSALNLVPPWTVCVNAYTPDLSSTYLYFMVVNNSVFFYSANAGSNASIRIYTGSVDITSPTNVMVAGQEQKIVWVCDGTTTKIYLNGTQAVSSPNIVGNFANTLLQVAGQNGGSWPASNLLRDLRIWQVALTAAQVAAL